MSLLQRQGMTCQELVELVTEYLEGTLSRRDRKRFEAHIADCPFCVTYVEQMREVARTMGRITEESIPPRAREELLVAFRGWARS
jgi:anti-sigma factor RsiW